jgi:hypothetical protein
MGFTLKYYKKTSRPLRLIALKRSLIPHQQRLSRGDDKNSTPTGFEVVDKITKAVDLVKIFGTDCFPDAVLLRKATLGHSD